MEYINIDLRNSFQNQTKNVVLFFFTYAEIMYLIPPCFFDQKVLGNGLSSLFSSIILQNSGILIENSKIVFPFLAIQYPSSSAG